MLSLLKLIFKINKYRFYHIYCLICKWKFIKMNLIPNKSKFKKNLKNIFCLLEISYTNKLIKND